MMRRLRKFAPYLLTIAAIAAIAAAPREARAIVLGQVDSFQDDSVAGWVEAAGSPGSIVDDAGPGGVGDHALNINNLNRLVGFNEAQWVGNFIAAGVNQIALDVRHQNSFTLQLRVGIAKGFFGMGGAGDTYVTSAAVAVPNDNVWRRVVLDISPSSFVPSFGNTTQNNPAAALADVFHLRLFHNPAAGDFRGSTGGIMQLDNITAASSAAAVDANFDNDLDVDGADFLTWQRGFGGSGTSATGDADGDGAVDGDDFSLWRRQFSEPVAAQSVPEPAALALVFSAAFGTFVLNRRRARAA